MNSAVLSPKYQIVIPEEIRNTLALKPGQRLQFRVNRDHIEIEPLLTGWELIGFFKGDRPPTLEREQDREF